MVVMLRVRQSGGEIRIYSPFDSAKNTVQSKFGIATSVLFYSNYNGFFVCVLEELYGKQFKSWVIYYIKNKFIWNKGLII